MYRCARLKCANIFDPEDEEEHLEILCQQAVGMPDLCVPCQEDLEVVTQAMVSNGEETIWDILRLMKGTWLREL